MMLKWMKTKGVRALDGRLADSLRHAKDSCLGEGEGFQGV